MRPTDEEIAVVTLKRFVLVEMRRLSQDRGWGFPLRCFEPDLPLEIARGVLRTLRAEGHVEPVKGLMTEDGAFCGAGYALTDKGWEYATALESGRAGGTFDASKPYGGDGSVPF